MSSVIWHFYEISSVETHFSPEKFAKSNIFLYLCSGIGEKSRTADALAYYFALTEKTSEIILE